MGVWGTGLYSGDFAMDLRSTVGAVVRLPFDTDRLVDILCETEPAAANNPKDEEHTTFWLVLADQFAKRGIASDRVREKALVIIDAAEDIAMLEKLGMKPADIRKRRRLLEEVRARVSATPINKPRTVLKKPQQLLMDRGDVIVYPTCSGRCINPYFASKELDKQYTKLGPVPLEAGWLGSRGDYRLRARFRVSLLVQAAKDCGYDKRETGIGFVARRHRLETRFAGDLLGNSLQEDGIGEDWEPARRSRKGKECFSRPSSRNFCCRRRYFDSESLKHGSVGLLDNRQTWRASQGSCTVDSKHRANSRRLRLN
jgi:hypothetical protein